MKLKIVLIMGLLSLGLNTNAQQEDYGETEKKHFLYDFIGDSDSLGLIDKKYVDAWWSVSDSERKHEALLKPLKAERLMMQV